MRIARIGFLIAILVSTPVYFFAQAFPLSTDSLRILTIGEITFSGNRVTKQRIMMRELTLHTGDTVSCWRFNQKLQRSRENLLNTSLFNFVTITPLWNADSSKADLAISVSERWYTWPIPTFEISEQNFNTWWQSGRNLKRANYGFILSRDNFRGLRENVGFRFRFGYAPLYGISYNIPYLNKKQTCGLGFSVSQSSSHEIAYATERNRLLYFRQESSFARSEFGAATAFAYRPSLYSTYSVTLRYTDARITDTVPLFLNDAYFPKASTHLQFFSLNFRFIRDRRDIRAYALKGWYFDIEASKIGFGLLKNESVDMSYVQSSLRRYIPLGGRFYASGYLRWRYELNKTSPYYLSRAMGFRDIVRGYEYYVIDGQHFALAKAVLKYQIIKPRVHTFNFIPFEKFNTFHYAFYGNLFSDAGYVVDNNPAAEDNPLTNRLLYSAGAGIDFVTYYDIVVRAECAINSLQQVGFFLHLNAAF